MDRHSRFGMSSLAARISELRSFSGDAAPNALHVPQMAARSSSPGECRLCGKSITKQGATIHIKSCWKQRIARSAKAAAGKWFQIAIAGRYSSDYWLQIQAPGKATFGNLDRFLRDIWLECCGHMSEFTFPEIKVSRSERGGWRNLIGMMDSISGDWDEEKGDALMDETLAKRLEPGMTFFHAYDFGTTTNLVLRVAAEHPLPAIEGKIKVLARNSPPAIECTECGKPATQVCAECVYDGVALCDTCAPKHECGEEMLMPLVNSPRSGVCGYTGPSVEP